MKATFGQPALEKVVSPPPCSDGQSAKKCPGPSVGGKVGILRRFRHLHRFTLQFERPAVRFACFSLCQVRQWDSGGEAVTRTDRLERTADCIFPYSSDSHSRIRPIPITTSSERALIDSNLLGLRLPDLN